MKEQTEVGKLKEGRYVVVVMNPVKSREYQYQNPESTVQQRPVSMLSEFLMVCKALNCPAGLG